MAPKMIIAIVLLVLGAYLATPESIAELSEKFQNAFTVVFTQQKTADPSANARIAETLIALPYIGKHWLFGNGDLSDQFNGGYNGLFGYFYPTDIGIIGAVFVYGIFGVGLFSVQFLLAMRYSKRLRQEEKGNSIFIYSIQGFLVYYAIHSFVTGAFAAQAEIGLTFVTILYCASLAYGKGKD
jgi:hypothetical protein